MACSIPISERKTTCVTPACLAAFIEGTISRWMLGMWGGGRGRWRVSADGLELRHAGGAQLVQVIRPVATGGTALDPVIVAILNDFIPKKPEQPLSDEIGCNAEDGEHAEAPP